MGICTNILNLFLMHTVSFQQGNRIACLLNPKTSPTTTFSRVLEHITQFSKRIWDPLVFSQHNRHYYTSKHTVVNQQSCTQGPQVSKTLDDKCLQTIARVFSSTLSNASHQGEICQPNYFQIALYFVMECMISSSRMISKQYFM